MRAGHRPTIAQDEVLTETSCSKRCITLSSPSEENSRKGSVCADSLLHRAGWEFTALHTTILNESELRDLCERLKESAAQQFLSLSSHGTEWQMGDGLEINNCKLHIPPMLFGKDIFVMKVGHAAISISACDAVLCWAIQHTQEEDARCPLKVVKVPYAAKWAERMHAGFGRAEGASTDGGAPDGAAVTTQMRADWTFSSDYVCSLLSGDEEALAGVVLRARELPTLGSEGCAGCVQVEGLRSIAASAGGAPRSSSSAAPSPSAWRVQCTAESSIDYAMLRKQDEPILFYDEFLLYQDDLEDCGEVIFDAKVRVMPSCWFLLTKQYLRVDGSLVRCREARFFHQFPPPALDGAAPPAGEVQVHVEVCWRELEAPPQPAPSPDATPAPWAPAAAPAGAGARYPGARPPPSVPGAYPGSTASGGGQRDVLMGAQGKTMTHLLPLVNERDGIHQFFTLTATL